MPERDSAGTVVVRSRAVRVGRAMLCVLVLGTPAFLLALAVRLQLQPLLAADDAAIRWATEVTAASGLAPLLIGIQAATHPVVAYVLVVVFSAWAWTVKRMPSRALWAVSTMTATWVLGELLKLLVQRARPILEAPWTLPPGYSFPSGHALNATVAAAVVLVLLWPLWGRALRVLAVVVAVVVVLGVGWDRVLLGVHYPSDVVAGYLLGGCVTFSSWIGFVGPTRGLSSSG